MVGQWRRSQSPLARPTELTALMTIHHGSRRRSWLGYYATWVPFQKLEKAWWDTHVRGSRSVRPARGMRVLADMHLLAV